MSLPTNHKYTSKSCTPVSSNCVIWDGPDIPCLNICSGDSITEVMSQMASEFCDLLDYLNVENYDITCLNLTSDPENYQVLFQTLIERVCSLEGASSGSEESGPCPDNCIIQLPDCLQFPDATGTPITAMPIRDAVTLMANQLCTIYTLVLVNQAAIAGLDARITVIEAIPTPVLEMPLMQSRCVIDSPTAQPMNYVLEQTETQFCDLRTSTGNPTKIYQAIQKEGTLKSESRLDSAGGNMTTIPGWVSVVQDLSDSINNLWLAFEDTRAAVVNIQDNCCITGCGSILLNFRATLTSNPGPAYVTIFLDGSTIPVDFRDCESSGSVVTISDGTNNTTFKVPIISTAADPLGLSQDISGTSLDPNKTLTFSLSSCLTDRETETTCERTYTYTIDAQAICPNMTLTPGLNNITYSFSHLGTGYTYIIELFQQNGTTPVRTDSVSNPTIVVSGNFTSLSANEDYEIKVTITDSSGSVTDCARVPVSTLNIPCEPVDSVDTVVIAVV